MKCLSYTCKTPAEYKIDHFKFCPQHAIGYIGLKALLNTCRNSDETCSHCGKPLIDDFIAMDINGYLYCSIACAFACNAVTKLEDDDDNDT